MDIIKLCAVALAFVIVVGGGGLIYVRSKEGWGPFTMQAFGLVLLIPTILVLAVTGALSNEVMATLLGGVAGYIFGRGGGRGGGPAGGD